MKLENVVLLGFVNSALRYLEKEIREDGTEEEGTIDLSRLENIEEDLEERLRETMCDYSDSVAQLKESGSKAFEKFLEERQRPKLIEEFDELFQGAGTEVSSEADQLLEPYRNADVEEEYLRLIADASARAKEEEVDLDVDSLFAEVMDDKPQHDEIDDIFKEILAHEAGEIEVEAPQTPKVEEPKEEGYISSLVDDLKRQLQKEEDQRRAEVAERMSIYKKINDIYPYLSEGFVRAVYDMKNNIAIEYPLSENVIILHRLLFREVEHLRQFVEIVLGHDYNVNVDESKMIVDVFKEHYNTDGKIITNIFEIANQARLLGGEYDGYRVILKEDE